MPSHRQNTRQELPDTSQPDSHPLIEISHPSSRFVGNHMTWVNPKPGVVITRIDFETTDTDASPFLLGITLGSKSVAVSKF